jgi:PAS domain S-box-containing protein
MLETLKPHDHLCLIYESQEEWRAAVVPFIAMGLKRGEKCIYIVDTNTADEIRKYLGEEGVDVASAEKSGQLVVLHETEAYTREGSFDPDRMIALLIAETEKAITEGYPAVRVTGEMTWVLRGHLGSEKLLEYEAKLNRDFFPKYPCLSICQYDRWKFDPEIIKGVIMTHPLLVRGNHIYHNFYYVPPQEFLNRKRAELEVQHWLNNVEREQRIMDTLRESEKKYRTLTEQSLQGLLVVQDFRIVFANTVSAEISGYSVEELLSLPPAKVQAMVHPEDQALVWGRLRDRLAGKTVPSQYEYRSIRKDGTMRWLEMFANRIEYGGKPAIQGAIIDITERKQAEETLSKSEAKYRLLAENVRDVIWTMDMNLRFTYMSTSVEYLRGYTAEEVMSQSLEEIFTPSSVEVAVKAFEEELALESMEQKDMSRWRTLELEHLRRDGSTVWVEIKMAFLRDQDGQLVGILGVSRDITERRKLEEALREGEIWYRHIFDNAPFGIGFSSIDGKVINLNKAMENITGYSAEEFTRINLADTYVNKADREALLKELSRHGGVVDYPVQLRRKDGTIYDALVSARLTAIGNREFVQTICHDVTERKRAEEALRESEERYRFLVELSPEAIFVASEGKHVFTNSAGLKLLSASSPDQIIGKPVMDVIHPDYREIVAERMRKSMETGMAFPALEEKFLRLDGTEIDVEVRAAPLIYQGKPAMQAAVRDVSERKQAEEAVRLSEQNFRDSIENSPLGIRIVSEDGKILYANQALLDIYGYSSVEELEAVPGKHRYTPESYAEHRERVKKRKLGEHVPPNYEISIVCKDGQVRYLAVSRGEVLWDGEKQFQVVYQDITERKAREQEYQAIIRTTIDGFWQADMQGHFLDVNEAYCQLTGYSLDEILNMSITDIEAIEKPGETAKRIRKIKEVGYDRFETRHRRKDGEIVDVEISVNYLPIDSGRMFIFIRDITQRKQAEKALRESEARYRLLAENVRDVIWATDMDFRFTYVSPSVKYLGDRTAEEVMSLSLGQLLTPSSQELAMKAFAEELVMANATPQDPTRSRTLEVEFLRRDGSALWAELKMNFMRDAAGRPVGILGVMRDISERKKAEEQRREFEQRAQLASHLASVGELSAGVAHEINNPLTGVIGYAELLMQEDVPEHIKNDLEIIRDGAKRVADIVKGLLTFARQTRPERKLVDINQVLGVSVRLRAYELETSNIKVVTNLAPDLPLTIADPGQLQQVFLNLLINAEMEMKLAHGKGKLVIRTEQLDNTIRISFKDDGPGIAKENLMRIFDPFFSTREIGKGTGLGLSICHGIVTEHGGRIWAESKLGKGATFIVELPVVTEEKRPRRTKVARKLERATKGKILVVDDEPVVRRLLSQILTEEGHEVEATDDAKDALNRIKSSRYNLILLDMKLPGMSGSELYGRVKEIAESLAQRVVFITGDVMGVDTEAFLARTGIPYIHKPFDVEQLKAEIGRLLATPRPKGTAKSKTSNKKPKVKS